MDKEINKEKVIADQHTQTTGGLTPLLKFFNNICFECGSLIFGKRSNSKYCKECARKRRLNNYKEYRLKRNIEVPELVLKQKRESKWRMKEKRGLKYEKRYLIDNCVICGRDISMYDERSRYCSNCKERHDNFLIGEVRISQHMKKRYNETVGKALPDWKTERNIIDSQMRRCGLK